jgi:hypothetical protein
MYPTPSVLRRLYPGLVAACAALALAACQDDSVTAPAVQDGAPDAQFIASALARGMSNDAARYSVRDAMRSSPFDGHKLVLQDFLASPQGGALLASASRAAGLGAAEFQQRVQALPQMDFSMPVRANRRTWRGDAQIAVIAARKGRDALPAYTPDGRVLRASRSSAEGFPPFFYLEPAEPKGLRVHPQAPVAGAVIEDADDGRGSESLTLVGPDGKRVVIDFATATPTQRRALEASCDPATAFVPCDDGGSSGGGFPPPPSDTTRLVGFQMNACDDDACWTDLEIRVELRLYNSAGTQIGYGEYRRGSVEPTTWTGANVNILYQRLSQSSGGFFQTNLVEEDRGDLFGVNKDDFCGTIQFGASANGATLQYPLQYPDCWRNGWSTSGAVLFSWTPKA